MLKKIFQTMCTAIAIGVFSTGCGLVDIGKDDSMKTNTPVIKMGTFNIRCPMDKNENSWKNRAPLLAQVIQHQNPDIFGVQEAEKPQVDDILRANPCYTYVGGGRYDFKNSGEHSCIFYKPERFELLETGTFTLSETPNVAGSLSWNTKSTRIATWGKFRDLNTGKEFCYYNTHLDFDNAGFEGAKLIVNHIKENGKDMPLMFSGDFNANRDSKVYHLVSEILKDSEKVSEKPHVGPGYTYQAFGKWHGESPIDYIFVSSDIHVLSHATVDEKPENRYASDHYPIFIEITLP